MSRQAALFVLGDPPAARGRIRAGLEDDIRHARAGGHTVSAAGVAMLRTLADQLDALGRSLGARAAPRDRVSLATLVRQFDATYARVFAPPTATADPLESALADFHAAHDALTEYTDTGDPPALPHTG